MKIDEIKIKREMKTETPQVSLAKPVVNLRLRKKEMFIIAGGIIALVIGYFSYQSFANVTLDVSLQTNTNLQNGLVAYWTFDNSTTQDPTSITDVTGNGHTASTTASSTQYFTSAGSASYVVPNGVTSVIIKGWGAGGGGGDQGVGGGGGPGGGGGFAKTTITTTPGETLTISVGGAGAGANTSSEAGGGGGGYSSVTQKGSTVFQAGGGGGGSADGGGTPGAGGGGGGSSGVAGTNGDGSSAAQGGQPGTSGAGGAGGAGGTTGVTGATGSANTGGAGGKTSGGTGGGSAGGTPGGGGAGGLGSGAGGGGGGGGGRFGGGGGGGNSQSGRSGGGGAGGSDLVTGTFSTETAGSGVTPGNNTDVDYRSSAGAGGAAHATGNPGEIAIISAPQVQSVAGRIGQAISFNNSLANTIRVSNAGGSLSGTWTVAFWAQPATSSAATTNHDTVLGSRGPTDNSFDVKFDTGGKIHADIGNGTTWLTTAADATINYNYGTWYHVVYVVTPTTYTIYVNGSQVGNGSYASDVPLLFDNSHQLVIGSSGTNTLTPAEYFLGTIDDVRIYNKALAASDVTRLYHLGATTKIATTIDTNSNLSNGLIGYWNFDGANVNWQTGTITDSSSSGNNGTVIAMSTTSSPVPGRRGGALQFNGSNQYVNMGNVNDFSTDYHMTLAAWVKTTNHAIGGQVVLGKNDNVNPWRGYELILNQTADGQIEFDMENNAAGGANDMVVLVNNTVVNDGRWHHIVATNDGTGNANGSKIYLDGVSQTLTINNNSLTATISNTVPFEIGARGSGSSPGANLPFSGQIDDVRVYNKTLSTADVSRLYQLGATTHISTTVNTNSNNSNGLVGYWNFDGANVNWSTGTITDTSGSGNNGTVFSLATTSSPVPGKMGQGMSFNGSTQYISLGNAYNFSGTASFSLTAWIKMSSLSGSGRIISKYGSSGAVRQFILGFNTAPGYPAIQFEREVTPFNNYSNTQIQVNKWYHVAAVYDGTNAYIYINGVSDITPVAMGSVISNTTAVEIGRDNTGAGFFAGTIDDLRVYNRALSAAEVLRLYQLGQ